MNGVDGALYRVVPAGWSCVEKMDRHLPRHFVKHIDSEVCSTQNRHRQHCEISQYDMLVARDAQFVRWITGVCEISRSTPLNVTPSMKEQLVRQSITIRILFLFLAIGVVVCRSEVAQGELRSEVTTGFWIPFLPSYELANGFEQPLDQRLSDPAALGGQIGFQCLYRFQPTRSILEFDLNFAYADGVTSDSVFQLTSTESVDGDIFHHSQYIGLRDRFDLTGRRIGILDIGCGFSHLRYDQNLTTRTDPIGFMINESIDNDYLGGEMRSSITRMIHNRAVTVDFNIGLFDLDGRTTSSLAFDDGSGTGVVPVDSASPSFDSTAFTMDLGIRCQTSIFGITASPGISFKYLSDMATITHPETLTTTNYDGVGVRSEEAYFLSLNLELLL